MSNNKVWVSWSMMDSTLIKSFKNPLAESDPIKLVSASDANDAGKPLEAEDFPAEVYHKVPSKNHKQLPDFGMAGGWVVSEAVAEVFR